MLRGVLFASLSILILGACTSDTGVLPTAVTKGSAPGPLALVGLSTQESLDCTNISQVFFAGMGGGRLPCDEIPVAEKRAYTYKFLYCANEGEVFIEPNVSVNFIKGPFAPVDCSGMAAEVYHQYRLFETARTVTARATFTAGCTKTISVNLPAGCF